MPFYGKKPKRQGQALSFQEWFDRKCHGTNSFILFSGKVAYRPGPIHEPCLNIEWPKIYKWKLLEFLPIFARFIYAHRRPEPRGDCWNDAWFLLEDGWQRMDDGYRISKRVMPDSLVISFGYKSIEYQVISRVFGIFLRRRIDAVYISSIPQKKHKKIDLMPSEIGSLQGRFCRYLRIVWLSMSTNSHCYVP